MIVNAGESCYTGSEELFGRNVSCISWIKVQEVISEVRRGES
jgi:hypothetical protein